MEKEDPSKRGPKKLKSTKVVTEKRPGKRKTNTFDIDKDLQKRATQKAHTPEANAKREASKTLQRNVSTMVEGDILNCVRDNLLKPNVDGKPWFERFVQGYLTEAEADPNSKAAQLLASNIFSTDLLQKLDAEREKMLARDIAFSRYRLTQTMFDKQIEFVGDRISKFICNMSSRRAGKTESIARKFIDTCLQPNTPACYIHMTFQNGIDQLYPLVLNMAEIAGLVIKSETRSDGIIEFTNGSVIRFRGNANKAETEKVRGFKYRLVVVDEAQSQRNLKYLVEDVIQPLLLDYADSQLILSGTPPRVPHTYFEDAFIGKEYKSYHWDMTHNPFIPNVHEALLDICKRKGLTMDSPLIQREYLGKIIYDTEALLFKDYKTFDNFPSDFIPERIYIGVDYGFSDNNAIVPLVANLTERRAYVLNEAKFNKATISQIVEVVQKRFNDSKDLIIQRNHDVEIDGAVTCYCDTNEQSISYEFSQTYRIPTWNAYKYDKMLALEQLAEYTRTGKILVQKDGPLADEFERTVKKRDSDTDAILNELDDDVYHPDAVMALLYASRQFFFDIGEETGGESTNLSEI